MGLPASGARQWCDAACVSRPTRSGNRSPIWGRCVDQNIVGAKNTDPDAVVQDDVELLAGYFPRVDRTLIEIRPLGMVLEI